MNFNNPEAPATQRQTWALRMLNIKLFNKSRDFRNDSLTMQQASDMISDMSERVEALAA